MAPEVDQSRVRREDPPLVTGRATYTDDLVPDHAAHAAVVRSRFAHADVLGVDAMAAERLDGVLAVYTAADRAAAGVPGAVHKSGSLPGAAENDVPLLAADRVRFAGEPVALVGPEDRYVTQDADDQVADDFERRPAVTDARGAVAEPAEGGISTPQHAAIDGEVTDVTESHVVLER